MLRGSFDAFVRIRVRVLHELHIGSRRFVSISILPKVRVSISVAESTPAVHASDRARDQNRTAAAHIVIAFTPAATHIVIAFTPAATHLVVAFTPAATHLVVAFIAAAAHLAVVDCDRDRNRDRDTASTSKSVELSNPNAFYGGKEC